MVLKKLNHNSIKENNWLLQGYICVHSLVDNTAEKLYYLLGSLPCCTIQAEQLLLVLLDAKKRNSKT
jgi:hypothetical protein